MRGFGLIALVLAMAAAAYLYQQNLRNTAQQLGASSPKDIKPQLDQLKRCNTAVEKELGRRTRQGP